MCTPCTNPRIHRPVTSEDIFDLKEFYPSVSANMIDEIYSALTDWNVVTPVVPTVVIDMVYRYQIMDNGSYENPTLPFSAMALKSGQRLQTPEMVQCHHVFESLTLAQRNVELLQKVLKQHGTQMIFFCDCGCKIQASDSEPYTEEYLRVNAYRSYWEAVGAPVILCDGFDSKEWKERCLDMGHSEIESYRRIARFLGGLPKRNSTVPDQVMQGREHLKERFPCGCGDKDCSSSSSAAKKSLVS